MELYNNLIYKQRLMGIIKYYLKINNINNKYEKVDENGFRVITGCYGLQNP